eukprot:6199664-Pleurochrysis_carterae.AAC.3
MSPSGPRACDHAVSAHVPRDERGRGRFGVVGAAPRGRGPALHRAIEQGARLRPLFARAGQEHAAAREVAARRALRVQDAEGARAAQARRQAAGAALLHYGARADGEPAVQSRPRLRYQMGGRRGSLTHRHARARRRAS